MSSHVNNKRIAKNTALLYVRTLIVMLITLYTSRVILKALGVEDYGVYQVVGGMVAMFTMISGSLSAAISRFITYEIGRGDKEKLNTIFSTSVYVQIIISVVVLVLAEIIGIWFMETQMQIPDDRLFAAKWVLHCSLITFCINLLSIPYNACIIAHEHMGAFAYIGVFDSLAKLGISFLIMVSPCDRLIFYALCMTGEALLVRFIYSTYCRKHFEESRRLSKFDKVVFKEMFGFAGWGFITSVNGHLNNQGVSMLVNVFFGVVYNASRGIASQVEGAVLHFVNSFTTAFKPQIVKSYAINDIDSMALLVYRAAKFAYFAMLLMMLPIIMETEIILDTWLTVVPDQTAIFVKLSLIIGSFDCIGASAAAACYATGRIKKYAIILGLIGVMEFPFAWILFLCGAPIVSAYYLYIFVKCCVLSARVYLMQDMVGLPINRYIKNVLIPIVLVTIVAVIPPLAIQQIFSQSYGRLILTVIVTVGSVVAASLLLGMTQGERNTILSRLKIKK